MNKFRILSYDSGIWNHSDLLKFLSQHQEQDIVLDLSGEVPCLHALGVYKILELFDFRSVTISTANIFEQYHKYNIAINKTAGFRFFAVPPDTNYSQYHQWDRTNIFGALYNRPYWHRMGIMTHLKNHYEDRSTLNFRYDPHNEVQRKEFEIQALYQIDPVAVQKFMSISNQLPMQLEKADGYTVGVSTVRHTDQLGEFYRSFLIDIVAESYIQGQTFCATEKTVRPMLLKKPFILMGSKCSLIHLRQMGFCTFHDYWDESYDGYAPADKYRKILELIDALAVKSDTELTEMYGSMRDILDHNYNLLITRTYNKNITYVD
jgi:hypothetical protein